MKRPILVVTLGFIAGIIGGLYLNIVPFIFLFMIFIILTIKFIKIKHNNNYVRILMIFINNNLILIFLISAFASSIYLLFCNNKFEILYNKFNKNKITAIVVSNVKETKYKNTYKIKLEKYKDIYFILRIPKSKKMNINYGDKIEVFGEYIVPEISRNYGGFNYRKYLKTQKVYGIFEANNVKLLDINNVSKVELFSNNVKRKIISNVNKILPQGTSQLFLGILIGYDDYISENIEESFRKSSLTHLLAVSGAHISYIIIGFDFLFKKLKIPKNITKILTVVFLTFFMYITDFTASVVRASIMGIILLLSSVFYRKNDMQTSISMSILLILIENPYKILDIGLILSYFATIGIICFSKLRNSTNKNVSILKKITNYLKELILITTFANIFVIPIMIYNFNSISLTFVISNLIAGILIGPITIGGFILIIISFINLKFSYIISIPYNLLLELLIKITNFTSLIPLSEILVSTPNIIVIIIYYLFLFFFILYIFINKKLVNRYLVKKANRCLEKFFIRLKKNSKIIYILIMFIILSNLILKTIPQDLKIYFIDVGQGDSTFIITPRKKTILIDSGGNENYDVGKNTVLPYLLDRGITKLDYILISHFDTDHCKGFEYILKNIKVNNVIISKQVEVTENLQSITEIIKGKNINTIGVSKGDILKIDKYSKIEIFSPENKENIKDINDNSIIAKFTSYNTSILFTGDASQEIEKQLINKDLNLKADILKVSHHGSSTGTSEEFLEKVNPKISLIGVGKNNKFGHPNEEVLRKLKNRNIKIYRTDEMGEIVININKNGKIKTKSLICN